MSASYNFTMRLLRDFRFEAAHALPHVPEGHKCRRMHGHGYRLRVEVVGPLDPHLAWVMDFAELKAAVEPVIDRLDHRVLNEIPGLENPTAEVIARWIWRELKPRLPLLDRLELWETPQAGVVYSGEEAEPTR